jgi:ABC-type transport system involved in cytochrome c biogenesis permease component
MMILISVITAWGGDDWRIGMVNLSNSPEAVEFSENIKNSRSEITPYFRIVESDLAKAEESIRAGTLQMLIVIPTDFEQKKEIQIETFNINSDAMKNVRLRAENVTIENLNQNNKLAVIPNLVKDYPTELWRSAYIGGSSILLALFLGALMLAANLFAFDYENRTRKEVSLSSLHPSALSFGIIITSTIVSIILSIPTFLLAIYLFRFHIYLPNLILVYLMMVPILIACSSAGIFLAKLCKSYRIIQPVIILSSVATFCGAGGFVAVNMLPPAARTFADIWILSKIFEWFNPVMHNFQNNFSLFQYSIIFTSGVIGLLAIWYFSKTSDKIKGGM